MTPRLRAQEQLAALGVSFDSGHGTVEELNALIKASRAITSAYRAKRSFHQSSQCRGKARFTTEADARRLAKRIENPDVRQYQCGLCKGWHNGKTPRASL